MATQVYRVTQVLTAAGSPVARLQGIDEDSHEFRLELPTQLVQRAAPGHVLVLQWSLHALPEPLAPAVAQPQVAVQQVAAEAAPPASAASPRAVDDAFMGLMSRVRRDTSAADARPPMATTPPASQTRREPDLNDEFNKLLGSTRTKG